MKLTMSRREMIKGIFILAIPVACFITAAIYSAFLPTVYVRGVEKTCVMVESRWNHDCDNLPLRYHESWIN